MPIYEYRCTACKEVTEVIQKVGDPPLRKCPKCSAKVEKMISRGSFQLKGEGWYAQGYGRPAKSESKGSTEESKDSKGTKEAPAKETAKPSEKSEKKDSTPSSRSASTSGDRAKKTSAS